jgi:hypothetical protein
MLSPGLTSAIIQKVNTISIGFGKEHWGSEWFGNLSQVTQLTLKGLGSVTWVMGPKVDWVSELEGFGFILPLASMFLLVDPELCLYHEGCYLVLYLLASRKSVSLLFQRTGITLYKCIPKYQAWKPLSVCLSCGVRLTACQKTPCVPFSWENNLQSLPAPRDLDLQPSVHGG